MREVVVTAFFSDWVTRVTFGLIALVCVWVPTHVQIRERAVRHVLLLVAVVCILILIHLPRLPGVVQTTSPAPAKLSVRIR